MTRAVYGRELVLTVTVLVLASTVGALSCARVPAIGGFGTDQPFSCTAKPDVTAGDIEARYDTTISGGELLREQGNTTLIVVPWLMYGNETFEDNARRIDPLCEEDLDTVVRAIEDSEYEPMDFFYLIPDDPAVQDMIPSGEDPRTCTYPEQIELGDLVGITDRFETKDYCYETTGPSGCPTTVIDGHAFITTMIEEDNYEQALGQFLSMYWLVLLIGLAAIGIGLKRGFRYLDPRDMEYKRGAAVLGGYILVNGAISIVLNLAVSNPWGPLIILVDNWFLEAVMIAYIVAGLSGPEPEDNEEEQSG